MERAVRLTKSLKIPGNGRKIPLLSFGGKDDDEEEEEELFVWISPANGGQ